MPSNPYAPPHELEPFEGGRRSPVEWRRGPAWYIVFGGLAGGFASVPFLLGQSALGLATVLVGCVLGGLLFRIRSHSWPHDPSVRVRQIFYSIAAILLPPLCLFFLVGPRGQGAGIMVIGGMVGASVACGIFTSGTRRFAGSQRQPT